MIATCYIPNLTEIKTPALKKVLGLLFVALFAYLSLYSQSTYVFFGSFNWDKSKEGIYVYKLDTTSGQLTQITTVKGVYNPSYLTLSPNAIMGKTSLSKGDIPPAPSQVKDYFTKKGTSELEAIPGPSMTKKRIQAVN